MLSLNTPISGHLEYPRQVITHQVELDSASNLVIDLDSLDQDVNVSVSSAETPEEILFEGTNTGTAEEHIKYSQRSLPVSGATTLPAGTYLIKLELKGDVPSTYRLTARTSPSVNTYNLKTLSTTPVTYIRAINNTTTHNYQFTVAKTGIYTMGVNSSLLGSTGISMDLTGPVNANTPTTGSFSKMITKKLTPGNYNLAITSTQTEDYMVSIHELPNAPGSSLDNPITLAFPGLSTKTVYGRVSLQQPETFYRIFLPKPTDMIALLSGLKANADLYLLDSAGAQYNLPGSVPVKSENVGSSSEYINVRAMTAAGTNVLPAGIYYLKVAQATGNTDPTDYALTLRLNYVIAGDMLRSDATSGSISYQTITNMNWGGGISLGTAVGWSVFAAGDINNDGQDDALIANGTTTGVWYLNAARSRTGTGALPTLGANEQMAGSGDFNGDGLTDIVVVNRFAGVPTLTKVWVMNGNTRTATVNIPTNGDPNTFMQFPPMVLDAVEDFDGDGDPDLLYENMFRPNQPVIVFMDGTDVVSTQRVEDVAAAYPDNLPSGAADYNGDNIPDLTNFGGGTLWFSVLKDYKGIAQRSLTFTNGNRVASIKKASPTNYIDFASNSSATTGVNLGSLSGTTGVQDAVQNTADTNDMYYFDLAEGRSSISVNVTTTANVTWNVYRDNPTTTALAGPFTGNNIASIANAVPGARYVVVFSTTNSAAQQYSMTLNAS